MQDKEFFTDIRKLFIQNDEWPRVLELTKGFLNTAKVDFLYRNYDEVEFEFTAIGYQGLKKIQRVFDVVYEPSSPRQYHFSGILESYQILEQEMYKDGRDPRTVFMRDPEEPVAYSILDLIFNSAALMCVDSNKELNMENIQDTINTMIDILIAKSSDYGQAYRRAGIDCVMTRIWEKIARYSSLMVQSEAKFESREDSMRDLLGYAIIAFALLMEYCEDCQKREEEERLAYKSDVQFI